MVYRYEAPLVNVVGSLEAIDPREYEQRISKMWYPEGGPKAIDINPTARCQLECACWSENHSLQDGLTAKEWSYTLRFFAAGGTKSVTITGGEPLLRRDLNEILDSAKSLSLRTTLSTNTLLLAKRANEILPYIDEIGIPIDGSTAEMHGLSRPGKAGEYSYHSALAATKLIRKNFPNIAITIRTVLSQRNIGDIIEMSRLIEEIRPERWKIYKWVPTGYYARQPQAIRLLSISDEAYESVVNEVTKRLDPASRVRLSYYVKEERAGRYVFIGSQGDVWGIGSDGLEELQAGNILTSMPNDLIKGVKQIISGDQNDRHSMPVSVD